MHMLPTSRRSLQRAVLPSPSVLLAHACPTWDSAIVKKENCVLENKDAVIWFHFLSIVNASFYRLLQHAHQERIWNHWLSMSLCAPDKILTDVSAVDTWKNKRWCACTWDQQIEDVGETISLILHRPFEDFTCGRITSYPPYLLMAIFWRPTASTEFKTFAEKQMEPQICTRNLAFLHSIASKINVTFLHRQIERYFHASIVKEVAYWNKIHTDMRSDRHTTLSHNFSRPPWKMKSRQLDTPMALRWRWNSGFPLSHLYYRSFL